MEIIDSRHHRRDAGQPGMRQHHGRPRWLRIISRGSCAILRLTGARFGVVGGGGTRSLPHLYKYLPSLASREHSDVAGTRSCPRFPRADRLAPRLRAFGDFCSVTGQNPPREKERPGSAREQGVLRRGSTAAGTSAGETSGKEPA